ncbi:MAG: hypothetical protein ACLFTQ_02030 [Candidatus Aenigmatarchaeota archaeon]
MELPNRAENTDGENYFGRVDLEVTVGDDGGYEIKNDHFNRAYSLTPGSLLFEYRNNMEGRHVVFARRARENGNEKELLGIEAGEVVRDSSGNGEMIEYEVLDYFPGLDLYEVRKNPESYLEKILPKLD